MKHARVFRGSKRQSRRRKMKRIVLPVIALFLVIGGTALIARALYLMTDQPTSGETVSAESDVSGSATHGTSHSTTTYSTSHGTTYGTSYEVTTTAPTTATTAKPTTLTGELIEGHFVQDRGTTPWNLVLANPWNPLPEGFDDNLELKGNLKGFSHEQVDIRAYESLKKMLADGAQYNLSICSGYRSVAKQTALFEGRVDKWMAKGYSREAAEKEVLKDTAYPGTSEHNTGLAADLLGAEYTWLSESFAETDAYEWLIKNCAKYGFILRYPKGREDITGYTFEPWHYRYVGVEAATYIMENNLTLEEYLEQQAQ